MKSASDLHLADVTAVYNYPEGSLRKLLGQQIHIGG